MMEAFHFPIQVNEISFSNSNTLSEELKFLSKIKVLFTQGETFKSFIKHYLYVHMIKTRNKDSKFIKEEDIKEA